MAQYSVKYPFNYAPRGGTIDELGNDYVREISEIYSLLNELRENKEGTISPQAHQIKVDNSGKIYIRNNNNTEWVFLGDSAENLGLNNLGFVKKADIGLDSNGNITSNSTKLASVAINANSIQGNEALVYDSATNKWVNKKVALINSQGKIEGSVTGGASTIANYPIVTENIQDGEILIYRPSKGGFVNETKAMGVGAHELSFSINDISLGNYSGVATRKLNLIYVGSSAPVVDTNETYPPVWIETAAEV